MGACVSCSAAPREDDIDVADASGKRVPIPATRPWHPVRRRQPVAAAAAVAAAPKTANVATTPAPSFPSPTLLPPSTYDLRTASPVCLPATLAAGVVRSGDAPTHSAGITRFASGVGPTDITRTAVVAPPSVEKKSTDDARTSSTVVEVVTQTATNHVILSDAQSDSISGIAIDACNGQKQTDGTQAEHTQVAPAHGQKVPAQSVQVPAAHDRQVPAKSLDPETTGNLREAVVVVTGPEPRPIVLDPIMYMAGDFDIWDPYTPSPSKPSRRGATTSPPPPAPPAPRVAATVVPARLVLDDGQSSQHPAGLASPPTSVEAKTGTVPSALPVDVVEKDTAITGTNRTPDASALARAPEEKPIEVTKVATPIPPPTEVPQSASNDATQIVVGNRAEKPVPAAAPIELSDENRAGGSHSAQTNVTSKSEDCAKSAVTASPKGQPPLSAKSVAAPELSTAKTTAKTSITIKFTAKPSQSMCNPSPTTAQSPRHAATSTSAPAQPPRHVKTTSAPAPPPRHATTASAPAPPPRHATTASAPAPPPRHATAVATTSAPAQRGDITTVAGEQTQPKEKPDATASNDRGNQRRQPTATAQSKRDSGSNAPYPSTTAPADVNASAKALPPPRPNATDAMAQTAQPPQKPPTQPAPQRATPADSAETKQVSAVAIANAECDAVMSEEELAELASVTGMVVSFADDDTCESFAERQVHWVPPSPVSPLELVVKSGLIPHAALCVSFLPKLGEKHSPPELSDSSQQRIELQEGPREDLSDAIFPALLEKALGSRQSNAVGLAWFDHRLARDELERALVAVSPHIVNGTVFVVGRLTHSANDAHLQVFFEYLKFAASHRIRFEWIAQLNFQTALRCISKPTPNPKSSKSVRPSVT